MEKFYKKILQALMRADVFIVLILMSNIVLYGFYNEKGMIFSTSEFALLILVDSFLVIWVINRFYELPIMQLKRNIQLFVV
jgi:hypothetical protein